MKLTTESLLSHHTNLLLQLIPKQKYLWVNYKHSLRRVEVAVMCLEKEATLHFNETERPPFWRISLCDNVILEFHTVLGITLTMIDQSTHYRALTAYTGLRILEDTNYIAFKRSVGCQVLLSFRVSPVRIANRIFSLSLMKLKLNSVAWVRERTIPTERPPLVGEVSVNFCG
jgi:hypothetical protein